MIPKWYVLGLGIATAALCFLLVEILGRSENGAASRNAAIAVLAVLVLLVVLVIAFALVASFQRRESPKKSVLTIAISYATLILSFASIYYVLAAVADYDDAVAKAVEYGATFRMSDPDGIPYRNIRAFNGIDERLWSGVDWLPGVPNDREYSVKEMRQAARRNHIVRFLPEERAAVFFQCLHLSIATITSTGYGDITPARPISRFFTDIEMLSGTSLLVVALGIVFSKSWERNEPRSPH